MVTESKNTWLVVETYNLSVLNVILVAKRRMKPIASSEGAKICCPEDGRVSFFNSPYPAHALFAGIDVYPKRMFGDVAPSPVRGEVKRIRRIKCPRGKSFESSDWDYVILLAAQKTQRDGSNYFTWNPALG